MNGRAALCLLLVAAWVVPAVSVDKDRQPPLQKVTVTDFAAGVDCAHTNIREALKAMAADLPRSRAVTACPISGRQVRIIRTGARWAALPKDAVFLLLGCEEPPGPDLVFASQREYVQYLARHPDAARHKPKPLRLAEALKKLTTEPEEDRQKDAQPPASEQTP